MTSDRYDELPPRLRLRRGFAHLGHLYGRPTAKVDRETLLSSDKEVLNSEHNCRLRSANCQTYPLVQRPTVFQHLSGSELTEVYTCCSCQLVFDLVQPHGDLEFWTNNAKPNLIKFRYFRKDCRRLLTYKGEQVWACGSNRGEVRLNNEQLSNEDAIGAG